jgi:uncharacterized cupin superfamily protein
MKAHDIRAVLAQLPGGAAAFTKLASFDGGGVFLGRSSGQTPWECHPSGDELVHILDGELEITVRDGTNPVQATLVTGSVFVVPRGRWHRQNTRTSVTLLSVTPLPTKTSVEDPSGTDAKRGRDQRRSVSRALSKKTHRRRPSHR